MSLGSIDNEFLFALRTQGDKRSQRELSVIYSRLNNIEALSSMKEQNIRSMCAYVRYETHKANEILYRNDDPCRCWYLLMSGSVFIQGSMFLPYASFGKQIPGTKRRGCQCVILEPSEMLAVDYPDMALHSSGVGLRPHALRHNSSNSNSRSTLDSVAEADTSSPEDSPLHRSRNNSLSLKSANGQLDNISQSSLSQLSSKENDEGEDYEEDDDLDGDSLSLHSNSSIYIKDLVIDVLKKDINDRNVDDLEILLEFTKSLRAFSNMTEPIRRALCKVMVFAWVETKSTVVLNDNEVLDSWSVIINGQVQVSHNDEEEVLAMGDSFGVNPTLDKQTHKGVMITICDDCQFLCIAQQEYYEVLHQGQENIQNIYADTGDLIMVKEKRELDGGTKKGNIVIRGTADSLINHLIQENSIDSTYIEDFLLTYRAFIKEPLKICNKLLGWFDNTMFRDKVTRVVLLWVNNHFNDFENDWHMMALLEEFEVKLQNYSLKGEIKLFNIACSAKAKPRAVTMTRESNEADLGFEIVGGSEKNFPIFIKTVQEGSIAEKQGIKRGDQLLQCNGQNFEKLTTEKGLIILNKNTNLNLLLKTSLFAFKEMVSELNNPRKKSLKSDEKTYYPTARGGRGMSVTMVTDGETFEKPRKAGTLGRKATRKIKRIFKKESTFNEYVKGIGGSESSGPFDDSVIQSQSRKLVIGSSATIDSARTFRQTSALSLSNPDLLEVGSDLAMLPEVPEDVIKVYRADQSHRFLFVNRNMTAGEAAMAACKEFGITEDLENYALYKISVQGEKFVKQSKLPEPLVKLADIPLGSRYYLKNKMNSEQLLPDENIPELLKEANFSFLDLNCFEVALHLTREDYSLFQQTEPANFIEDLFNLETDLEKFKKFEDLVNKELFWVVTTICNEPSIIQRSKIIKHFVKIAHQCKIIKNLNSTFALISGLGYRAVSRMKQTWEKVPAKMNKMFEELQALMDPSRNMSKYRTLLNDFISQPPVIPYVPVLKKDLTFLHLGNDTSVDGLINFEKMRMIGKEVRNIFRLCAVDKSQILPSAMAYRNSNQKESEKGTSSTLYQTLNRRGRRSSFNNARRMYEDQVNVRRVKQYMDKFMGEIVSDEDQLMEMSKTVEPQPAPTSAQTKRRPTYAESPTRSSKTLPASNRMGGSASSNGGITTRNNSEPYLAPGHPSKKKVPVSSLPKFGANSPKALRKLMALSEEGGSDESGKKNKLSRRSASTSSHEISPATSPYMSPKRSAGKLGAENNHTIALENSNRNNNRLSLPPNMSYDPSHSSGLHSAPMINRKFFPTTANSGSATSSSRSSIASSSSIGTMSSNPTHSSMGSLGGGSNSPRSGSPVPWGSVGSLSTTASGSPRLLHNQRKSTNSPGRTSSSSSADTIKSSGAKGGYHEPPKIKPRNGRSSSFGSSNIVVSNKPNDRRLSQNSTSSPASNQANSQQSLILPNLPQIPRTPSMDSGVASTGSVSADSARFSHTDESELFARGHRGHPLQREAAENNVQQSRAAQNSGQAGDEKVEQTFLFGCRGQWDPPRPEIKDPAYVDNYPAAIDASHRKFSMPGHHNTVVQLPYTGHNPHQIPRGFSGKSGVKGIKDYLICERHAMMRSRMIQSNNNNNNNFYMLQQSRHPISKTPDALLEEQLVLELQKQKPPPQKVKRQSQHVPETQSNLVDMRRFSLSKSDPALNRQSTPEQKHPDTARLPPHTSSPISSRRHHDHEAVMYQHHQYDDMQIMRPNHLQLSNHSEQTYTNSPQTPQSFHSTSTPVQRTHYPDDLPVNWQYPEKHSRSASDVGLPRTPYEVANLNATMPTIGEHYQEYNMTRVSQHRHRNSYINYNPRQNSGDPDDAFRHYSASREQYTTYNNSSKYHDNAEAQNKLKFIQHQRVGSQEWCETDLDGEKRQQTMKAWGSSTSLPATPLSTKSSSQVLHQSLLIASRSSHGGSDVVDAPAKKPPVPQRSTSIGRTQQLRLSTNSTPPSSPPQSPTTPYPDDQARFNHIISSAARQSASFTASPIQNGHMANRSNMSTSNGSLPSYREAVHHIAKQNSIYQSPISTSYRSFNMDPHESQEQVSQV